MADTALDSAPKWISDLRPRNWMENSVTYQAIIEEGIERGEARAVVRGARDGLFILGRKKFGPPDENTLRAIEAITNLDELLSIVERVLDVSSWEQLLAR